MLDLVALRGAMPTAKDVPAPYAKNLIEYYMPSAEDAYQACRQVMYLD